MHSIKGIKLYNVRSHVSGEFKFNQSMNAIIGPNGSGKTTIIESLYTLLRGSSFKGPLSEIVKYGSNHFNMELTYESGETIHKRRLGYQHINGVSTKKWTVNEKNYARLPTQYRSPIVLFEPDLARLISGSPQRRRDYLDHIAAQLDPEIAMIQNKYDRTLRQRNKLLKTLRTTGSRGSDELFAWNTQLSHLGEKIVFSRVSIIEKLQKNASVHYQQLGGSDDVLLSYESTVSDNPDQYANRLLHFLETGLSREIALGHTAFGPHRDELHIRLADQPAESRASRGEIRTLVMALKLLETQILSDFFEPEKIKPTLLLDDVLSELDLVHQERVLEGVAGHQVFITTTDAHTITTGVHTIGLS